MVRAIPFSIFFTFLLSNFLLFSAHGVGGMDPDPLSTSLGSDHFPKGIRCHIKHSIHNRAYAQVMSPADSLRRARKCRNLHQSVSCPYIAWGGAHYPSSVAHCRGLCYDQVSREHTAILYGPLDPAPQRATENDRACLRYTSVRPSDGGFRR